MLNTIQANYYYFARKYNIDVVYTGQYFDKVKRLGINTYHDGQHPNITGSFLVALLFYNRIAPDASVQCDDIDFIYKINNKACDAINSMVNS